MGKGTNNARAVKGFQVLGSMSKTGPWEPLLEGELVDTRGKPASLLNFTFDELVQVQFLKFDLVSYWGQYGGGLQYFAAIPCEYQQNNKYSETLFILFFQLTLQLTATSHHGQNGLSAATAKDLRRELESAMTSVRQ